MRKLICGCGLIAGLFVVVAQRPSVLVRAQEKTAAKSAAQSHEPSAPPATLHKVDPAKETDIRELMNVTGAKDLGQQLMTAGMQQFRDNVTESQPDNPRAKQFVDAFVVRFQKHFDPDKLTESVIPIYDKHLSGDDLKQLLQYYRSPLGQRMLKVLPEVARESQAAGFALGQKAAEESMEDLRADYPEFVQNPKEEEKPAPEKKNP
jgi:uncharacterized protein